MKFVFKKHPQLIFEYKFSIVLKKIKKLFAQTDSYGTLMFNPYHPFFPSFRPDAILFYEHRLILIDILSPSSNFIPQTFEEISKTNWYKPQNLVVPQSESENETRNIDIDIVEEIHQRLKGGTLLLNPYQQLQFYLHYFQKFIDTFHWNIDIEQIELLNVCVYTDEVQPFEYTFGNYTLLSLENLENYLFKSKNHVEYSHGLCKKIAKTLGTKPIRKKIKTFPFKKFYNLKNSFEQLVNEINHSQEPSTSKVNLFHYQNWINIQTVLVNGIEFFKIFDYKQLELWYSPISTLEHYDTNFEIFLQQIEPKNIIHQIYDFNQIQILLNKDESKNLFYVPIRKDNDLSNDTIIIIIDAHFIEEEYNPYPFFQLGSGNVIRDLFSYLRLEETNRKLLIIGYGADALKPNHLINLSTIQNHYDGVVQEIKKMEYPYDPTSIKDILLPNFIEENFDKPFLDFGNYHHFKILDKKTTKEYWIARSEKYFVADAKKAHALNIKLLRHVFFKNTKLPCRRDMILEKVPFLPPPYTKYFLWNILYIYKLKELKTYEVELTHSHQEKVILKYALVKGYNYFTKKSVETWVFLNYLENSEPHLTDLEIQAIYQLLKEKIFSYFQKNTSTETHNLLSNEFWSELANEPFYTALYLNYGEVFHIYQYVKTLNEKFIFWLEKQFSPSLNKELYYRQLYRFSKDIHVNFYLVDNDFSKYPFRYLLIKDYSPYWTEISKIINCSFLIRFKDIDEKKYQNLLTIMPPSTTISVKGTIIELYKLLNLYQYELKSVIRKTDHIHRVVFMKSYGGNIQIDIHNKSDQWGSVSHVEIIKNTYYYRSSFNKKIYALIYKLYEESEHLPLEFPTDFRFKIYEMMQKRFAAQGLELTLVNYATNCYMFTDRFLIKKGKLLILFGLSYYNHYAGELKIYQKDFEWNFEQMKKWKLE